MKNELNVHGLYKNFGRKTILTDVSFILSTGDVLGLFGKNGSGKSTLLKILFGTLKPTRLELSINGTSIAPKTVIPEQLIGYLPQESFLPKHLKVRDIIPLFHENGDDQDAIFRASFVEKIASRKAGLLSMGEIRYLELLLVANLNHPFLMLDEPFSMIEPLYKDKIKEFLISLKAKKGIILTDHYYTDVFDVSTKNLVLKNGIAHEVHTSQDLKDFGYLK
ncbi:ABC-type multidrug transport system ATPase subunit [Dokdonia sp. Hel_I_63]|uniref:ATP-binding cassette domain-containing protein n=1 Tax=Dokdonia sp. Hel_I_63 TaxID=1249996 RepID=UPI001199055C|nr:ATP-binding cassette domain-containing protein [Dokdonia sp. Hel_I_63]TVZ21573.1 ABC-type multidrug transport system ATPase subunit [Dokdonia sp. Hel_I_63]